MMVSICKARKSTQGLLPCATRYTVEWMAIGVDVPVMLQSMVSGSLTKEVNIGFR